MDGAPTNFDQVGTLERRGVTCHAIVEQRFVAYRRLDTEPVRLFEMLAIRLSTEESQPWVVYKRAPTFKLLRISRHEELHAFSASADP